jgi:small GTP-binding protein
MAKLGKTFNGLFFVIALAVLGVAVLWVPPAIFSGYNEIAKSSPLLAKIYLGVVLVLGTGLAGYAGWIAYRLYANSRARDANRRRSALKPSQMSASQKEREILELLASGRALGEGGELSPEVRAAIDKAASRIQERLTGRSVELVAFGTISSGKSSLLNALAGRDVFQTDVKGGTTTTRSEIPWPGDNKVILVDTPGLAEVHGEERHDLARQSARDADLVLFVVDGPLKEFEHRIVAELAAMEKRVIICLNKQDWYSEADRRLLLAQIAEQVHDCGDYVTMVPVRAKSGVQRRVRVLSDGAETEEQIALDPDLGGLAREMMRRIERDGQELILANLLMQSRGMVAEAKEQVRAAYDARARQLVDRYMWQAGGLAAVSPFPVIDVAAAFTLSVKMVFDLAKVYQQPMDLETAQRLVGELGKNLVSILGMNLATPALGMAVASLLKTIPGIGTVTGGVLQGLVQALVTRWVGYVFIDYFRGEMRASSRGWAEIAREKWNHVTAASELTQLVRTGLKQLGNGRS